MIFVFSLFVRQNDIIDSVFDRKRGYLTISALDSVESSGLGSSPGWGHDAVLAIRY